jgi:hypothetical protein
MLVSELIGLVGTHTFEVLVVIASFPLLVVGLDEEDGPEGEEEAAYCTREVEGVRYTTKERHR